MCSSGRNKKAGAYPSRKGRGRTLERYQVNKSLDHTGLDPLHRKKLLNRFRYLKRTTPRARLGIHHGGGVPRHLQGPHSLMDSVAKIMEVIADD